MEITAVTFTNKAANEMKKRLGALLGQKDADALILGMSAYSINQSLS
jgi:superfamily I DNA/RNA helicase